MAVTAGGAMYLARGQPDSAGQVAVDPALLSRMLQGGSASQFYQLRMSNVTLPQPTLMMQNHTSNVTGFRGVRCRNDGTSLRWSAEIQNPATKKRKWLGTFNSAEEAGRAYDQAALSIKGCEARTNFNYGQNKLPASYKKRQHVPRLEKASFKDLAAAKKTLEQVFPRSFAACGGVHVSRIDNEEHPNDQQDLQPTQEHSAGLQQKHQQQKKLSTPALSAPRSNSTHVQTLALSGHKSQAKQSRQLRQHQKPDKKTVVGPVISIPKNTACGELMISSPALLPSIFSPFFNGMGSIPPFLQDVPSSSAADAGLCIAGVTTASAAAALARAADFFGFHDLDDVDENSLWSGDLDDFSELLKL